MTRREQHVVFTNGRSGSNFLIDCLNQHPGLCNYGETLGSYMPPMQLHEKFGYGGPSIESYLDYVLSSRRHFEFAQLYSAFSRLRQRKKPRKKRWANVVSVGIKDFAIRFEERDAAGYLASRPSIKVISLHRENSLRRAISLLALDETGIVAIEKPNSSGPVQLEVDIDQLIDQLKVLEEEKIDHLATVDSLDQERCFRLTYEDLFASPSHTQTLVAQAYRFLGVEPRPIQINQQRILPLDLRTSILNYREVERGVSGSGFGDFLDAP